MASDISKKRLIVSAWPDECISGAKRANLNVSEWLPDWFVGSGKDENCCLEGTWWDMICLAREILASENTKLACPEYYHPEFHVNHYVGGEPYVFSGISKEQERQKKRERKE